MPYLIYGKDTYRSLSKLQAIKKRYLDVQLGDTNLAVLDSANCSSEEIIRQIWATPFLAAKRLVVIHNLLTLGSSATQKAITDFLPKIPPTSVVVFYEADVPDKRTALFKHLNQPKQAEEFALLDDVALRRWAQRYLQTTGVTITPTALTQLLQITGPDLWRLTQEINKLSLFSPVGISPQDVSELVHTDPTGDIFQCLDALAERCLTKTIRHVRGRLASGDSPLYILSMFIYGFRTLLIVQDYQQRNRNQQPVPKPVGIHPYVWRKSLAQIRHFPPGNLEAIYRLLRDLDYACKIGIIEPLVALDLFVLELCAGRLKEGTDGQLAAHPGTR